MSSMTFKNFDLMALFIEIFTKFTHMTSCFTQQSGDRSSLGLPGFFKSTLCPPFPVLSQIMWPMKLFLVLSFNGIKKRRCWMVGPGWSRIIRGSAALNTDTTHCPSFSWVPLVWKPVYWRGKGNTQKKQSLMFSLGRVTTKLKPYILRIYNSIPNRSQLGEKGLRGGD